MAFDGDCGDKIKQICIFVYTGLSQTFFVDSNSPNGLTQVILIELRY